MKVIYVCEYCGKLFATYYDKECPDCGETKMIKKLKEQDTDVFGYAKPPKK